MRRGCVQVQPTINRTVGAADAGVATLTGKLLASDRRYFAAGAEARPTPIGRLYWLAGLSHLPAGCVAFAGPETAHDPRQLRRGLDELRYATEEVGGGHVRIYTYEEHAALRGVLIDAGFRGRDELAMLSTALDSAPEPTVTLVAVTDEAGWRVKLNMTKACAAAPDGHEMDPDAWCEMERCRCEGGAMRCYMIHRGGVIVGAVASMDMGELLRLKNLLVHPDHRGSGLGAAATIALMHEARRLGKSALGCFALDGGAGERTYRNAGMTPVARQTEWLGPELS